MKLAVFAALLLAFMVGLTLVQVDSNTETPLPTLSEAEMLATQGASTVGAYCAEYKTVSQINQDDCFTISECQASDSGSYKQYGSTFAVCESQNTTPGRNCYHGNSNQYCGFKKHFWSSWCISWLYTYSTYSTTTEVWSAPGC